LDSTPHYANLKKIKKNSEEHGKSLESGREISLEI
jgi:hypothetical protein